MAGELNKLYQCSLLKAQHKDVISSISDMSNPQNKE